MRFKKNPLVELICAQPYEKWQFTGFRFRIVITDDAVVEITTRGNIIFGKAHYGNESVKNNSKVAAKYAELEYEMIKRKLAP